MNIGIIGAGHIGSALARRFTELGHQVFIANSRGPDSLHKVAAKTGAKPVTAHEAARAGDVVVVTILQCKISELPKDLFAGISESVVLIDTGNYYPQQRDGRMAKLESSPSESRWVATQLGRPVVKAFNNIDAQSLGEKGQPEGTPGRIALPVAGDDAKAKASVMALIDQLGFDAIDDGGLDDSWRQQPGSPVYGKNYDAAGVRKALSEASQTRKPEWTATDKSPGNIDSPA